MSKSASYMLELRASRRIFRALAHKTATFSEIVEFLDLDPQNDFIYQDLSGVDFGATDVSFYNFTGTDLSFSDLTKVRGISKAIGINSAKKVGAAFPNIYTSTNVDEKSDFLEAERSDEEPISEEYFSQFDNEDEYMVYSFLGENLRSANLSGRDLSRIDFSGADLTDADLSDSNIDEALFRNSILNNADLRRVHAHATVFEDADLTGAKFMGSDLRYSIFDGAIVSGIDFSGSDISGASFVGSVESSDT